MGEVVRKEIMCYQQIKNKGECSKPLQSKGRKKFCIGEKEEKPCIP